QRKDQYRMDGNYFYSYSDSYNNEKIARENILPDGSYFTDTESRLVGGTISNQGSANLEFDIDKTTRVTSQPSLSVNKTDSGEGRVTETTDALGNLVNNNSSRESSEGMQRNFSNNLEIMKKLDTLGRYVRLYFENNNRINDSEYLLNSESNIFGDDPQQQILDQRTTNATSNDSYEVGASYRHMLGKTLYLDFRYSYSNNSQSSERSVTDFDQVTGEYGFNPLLSSDFDFRTQTHVPEITLGSNGQKIRFNFRARMEQNNLDNEDFIQDTSFSKNYGNLLFNSNFNYNMGSSKRLSLRYSSRVNTPSVRQ